MELLFKIANVLILTARAFSVQITLATLALLSFLSICEKIFPPILISWVSQRNSWEVVVSEIVTKPPSVVCFDNSL